MSEVNTNETSMLLSYMQTISRTNVSLISTALDFSKERVWIHLQRLMFTGHVKCLLEAKCLDPQCIGLTDVTQLFKNSGGSPVGIQCHGCGRFNTIDLDDTYMYFVHQNNDVAIEALERQNVNQERNNFLKIFAVILSVIAMGMCFIMAVVVSIIIVLCV